jgi:TRAP-type C4-dicarboxylate transport system substrate-binding protein
MKNTALLGIAIALAASIVGTAHAKDPQPGVLLKIATLAPEGSTWMKLMHEFDERVRQATGGEVGFKFYPGGVQGDERLVLKKIRSGQLHGGGFTGNGLGVIAPDSGSSSFFASFQVTPPSRFQGVLGRTSTLIFERDSALSHVK